MVGNVGLTTTTHSVARKGPGFQFSKPHPCCPEVSLLLIAPLWGWGVTHHPDFNTSLPMLPVQSQLFSTLSLGGVSIPFNLFPQNKQADVFTCVTVIEKGRDKGASEWQRWGRGGEASWPMHRKELSHNNLTPQMSV